MDDMTAWVGHPAAVQMRVPTEEELKKIDEKKTKHSKNFYRGLIAIARGHGVKVKKMSWEQYMKEMGNVNG